MRRRLEASVRPAHHHVAGVHRVRAGNVRHVDPLTGRRAHLQAGNVALREEREEVRVRVWSDAELIGLGGDRRIVRHPERELALRERGVERRRRQIERHRDHAQHARAERVHRVGVGEDGLAESRQALRPQVRADPAPPGAHERIVGRAFTPGKERFVQVRLVIGVDLRCPHHVPAERHVAVVVLVHQQRALRVHRLIVEAPRFGERPIDQRLRDAVVDHDEETDVLERVADLGRRRFDGAGAAGEGRAEVDDRDRRCVRGRDRHDCLL